MYICQLKFDLGKLQTNYYTYLNSAIKPFTMLTLNITIFGLLFALFLVCDAGNSIFKIE